MTIMYDFQTEDYEYEVVREELKDACIKIFSDMYEIDIEKAKMIFNDDWIDMEKAMDDYADELYTYFEKKAYREYIDRRYE